MKLHLPKLLRNSVLACITAVVGVATTTVGTATFTGGVVAFALAGQACAAEYTDPTASFANGDVLNLGDGKSVDAPLTIDGADSSITLNVTDGTVTWATSQGENKGVSTVNVAGGATLNVTSDEQRYCVFASKQGAEVTINLAANARMTSSNLFGWENQARGEGARVVNMGAGSEWTINGGTSFYLNQTTINLSGGTIVLGEGSNIAFERRANAINTTAEATQMSEISGTGAIKDGNNGANGDNGYTFNVVRGNFDIDTTNTADLKISALLGNSDSRRGFQKTGDGVMELTSDSSAFTGKLNVEAGELKISGAGNLGSGDLRVKNEATLNLATSATLAATINQESGGIVKLGAGQKLGANANLLGTVVFTDTVTLTGGTTTFDSTTTIFDLNGWTGGDTYQLFTVEGGTLTSAKVQVAGYTGDGIWVLDSAGLLTEQTFARWSGGSALDWSVGATFDDGKAYANGMLTTITGDQGDVTATVSGEITASELTVESGTNLILAGTGTVAAGNTVLEGDLTVKTTGNSLGGVTMSEGSSLIIDINGESTIAGSIGATGFTGGTIVIASGTTLTEETALSIDYDITVQGTLKLTAGDAVDWNVGYDQIITVDGGTLELGETRQSFNAHHKLILNDATITGTGDAYGALDFFENCTVTSTGDSTIDAPLRLRNANQTITFDVKSGTLTISSTGNGSAVLGKVGAGTLAVTGNLGSNGAVKVNAGTLKMLDGSSSTSAVNLTGGALAAAGTVTMATVGGEGDITVEAGGALTITNATGMLYKKGEGSLTIETMAGSSLCMNYEGPLTINTLNLDENAVLSYANAEGSSLLKLDSLSTKVYVDVFELQEQLATGIDLGIASSVASDKIGVLGLDAGEYTLENNNGYWKLTSSAELHFDWDLNWGKESVVGAPVAVAEVAIAEDATEVSLVGTAADNQAGVIAASLTGGNANVLVFGGSRIPNGNGDAAFQGDTWIRAAEGQYKLIVGGHLANSWGSGTIGHFNGDTHIVVDGATVGSIIGGTHQDGRTPVFTGNSYISIFSGDVTAAIVGAGTNAHGATTQFNGNTNIFIYTPLSTVNTNGMGGAAPGDAVVGAGASFDPSSRACTNNVTGNTNITVDLSGYTGEAANFSKKLLGGHFNWTGNGYNANINGDTNVNIIGNSTVTFAEVVVGGSRNNAGTINTTGTSSVNISGASTFSGLVVGGSYLDGNSTSTAGNTAISISGGTFNGAVYGGAYHANAGTSTTGDVTISLSGGTYAGRVVGGSHHETQSGTLSVNSTDITVSGDTTALNGDLIGGHYINGTGDAAATASIGDITITVAGGQVTNVYGGSYSVRNHADSTITQGDIVIDLQGGTVAGDVYAGGYQENATKLSTASTTVKLASGVTLTEGKTISGGYKTTQTGSVITGGSTLVFTDSQDRSGITFADFSEVSVVDGAEATVGALPTIADAEGVLSISKTGAGVLATTAGVADTEAEVSVEVNEGTLRLSGTAGLADSRVVVESGATLELAGTAEDAVSAASISGTGSIVKNGTGSTTLANLDDAWEGDIVVKNGTLNMGAQGSAAGVTVEKDGTLAVSGDVACDVTNSGTLVAASISGKLTSTGGSLELSGDDAITSTDVSISGTELKGTWGASGLELGSGVSVGEGATITLDGATLTDTVANGGTLKLTGTTKLDMEGTVLAAEYTDGKNGYITTTTEYTVLSSGSLAEGSSNTWEVGGFTLEKALEADGKLLAQGTDKTTYWVQENTVQASTITDAATTTVALNGGTFRIDAACDKAISVKANGGSIIVVENKTLAKTQLSGEGVATLLGASTSVYDLGSDLTLGDNAQLDATNWSGTVKTTNITISEATDLTALGNASSNIELGKVTIAEGGSINVDNKLTLNGETGITALGAGTQITAGTLVLGDGFSVNLSADLANLTQGTWGLLSSGTAVDNQVAINSIIGTGKDGLYKYEYVWDEAGKNLSLVGSLNGTTDITEADEDTTLVLDGDVSTGIEVGETGSTVGALVVTDHYTGETGTEAPREYTLSGGELTVAGDLTVGTTDGTAVSLTVSNATTVQGNATVNSNGALTMEGGSTLAVEGTLTTDQVTISSLTEGQATMISANEIKASTAGEDVIIHLVDDVVSRLTDSDLTEATYKLLSAVQGIVLDDANMVESGLSLSQENLEAFAKASKAVTLGVVPEATTFALRGAGSPVISLIVRGLTLAEQTWDTSGAGTDKLALGTLTDGVMKLERNNILDSVRKVVVTQNTTLDLSSTDTDAVNIKGLSGDKNLTISGNGDTVNITTAVKQDDGTTTAGKHDGALVLSGVHAKVSGQYGNIPAALGSGTLVKNGVQVGKAATAELDVKDSKVVLDGGSLSGDSAMDGGVLVVMSSNAAIAAGKIKVATGNSLSIKDTDIAIVGNATDSMVLDVKSTGTHEIADLGTVKGNVGEVAIVDEANKSIAVMDKYFTNTRLENGKVVADRNSSYYSDKAGAGLSENGAAGVAMADAALVYLNPQAKAPQGGLAAVLNLLDTATGDAADELGASLAGASTAVLGMATMGDVDRQLQAIRNRTTTMGVDQSVANEDMPYFNAWINAEGDRSELSESGTESGYELSSWGGTVGFDVDLCPTLTAGMALTAMYGDLDTTGADVASGNIDTYYVTAFARYAPSAWTHTFVATVGMSDISLDRKVAGVETKGETDGLSFGLMYEVGRVFALDEDGSTCLQPVFNVTWKHTTVDAYTEDGSDLALEVDEQTLDTVTFGLGARLQSVVGESMYNRTSILEARVLAKADVGDRNGSSDVALAALPGATGSVDSAEMGTFGLEAGAGLTIPVGQEGGSVFMDASVELRSDYTNVNGTVGYRINF